jgi:hypothetical protein
MYRITAVNSMGQTESVCQVIVQSNDTHFSRERNQTVRSLPAVNSMGQTESVSQVTVQSNDTHFNRERIQTVRSLPVFTQSLQNKTSQEGETLLFQIRVNGQPKPQVIWYKDNQPLRNTHDHKVCFNKEYILKKVFMFVFIDSN